METLLQTISNLSATPDNLSQLIQFLRTAGDVLDNAEYPDCFTATQHLDTQLHSLGIVYLLNAYAKRPNLNPRFNGAFIEYTSTFLRNCSAQQIQQIPEQFCSLCHKYKDMLIQDHKTARLGIGPLMSAVQRLAPGPEHLTPIHADVFQLCLIAKCYSAAAPLLASELTEVDPAKTSTGPTDFQLYCYYGGMLATGLKQLPRALELFLQGLTAPTFVWSGITAASYKKYVLVSLVHNGSVAPLPKFASQKVRQLVDAPEMKAYNDLVIAYNSKSAEKLARVSEQYRGTYSADGNVGLVKQVLSSLPVRTIQRLTQTYVTLSLADIAKAAGLRGVAEAETVILRMISCREVFAKINDRDGMVTFVQDPQQYNTADMARRLDAAVQQCTNLASKVQGVQDSLLLDRSYLNKLVMRERAGGSLGALGAAVDSDFAGSMFPA